RAVERRAVERRDVAVVHLNVRIGGEPLAQVLDAPGRDLGRDDVAGPRQRLGELTVARPDLQHLLTEVRFAQRDDPGRVVLGVLQIVERRGEVLVRAAWLRDPGLAIDGHGRHAIGDAGVPHDAVERAHAVAPSDLLALVVRATRVRDSDLVD